MSNIEFKNKRILVVDHIKQSRDTLKIFSYSLGVLSVATSSHAPDIFSLCEVNTFDIILLGYDLGDNKKNGQQILEELRLKNLISRNAIVIMITAEVSQAMVLAALEHKPDEYLTKPYTLKDLEQRITRCIEKKIVMHAIYRALDKQESRKVIHLCEQAIKSNSPYKHECLGIKSRQHFELQEYEKAKRIYSSYLATPNCQWAAIGLGKISLIENDYQSAEKYFNAIIDNNPFYLSAYDWLAKTYELTNEYDRAEEVLENALLVSPRSVCRLQKYAQLCIENKHLDKATSALSKNTDLAYHSIHRKPENAISFAESIIEHSDNLSDFEVRKLNYKAFAVLANMTRDFQANELKVIAQFLTAQLHQKANDHALAKNSLKDAERLLQRFNKHLSIDGTFTVAKSLIGLHRNNEANKLLDNLAQANPDNMEILSEVVALSDKPVSERDKAAAQAALEVGISLYKAKHFVLAIEKLNQALSHFPHHIGVKLNLLQVLLVSFDSDRQRLEDFNQAKVIMKQFSDLSPDSESYKRFLKLRNKYESLATFAINPK